MVTAPCPLTERVVLAFIICPPFKLNDAVDLSFTVIPLQSLPWIVAFPTVNTPSTVILLSNVTLRLELSAICRVPDSKIVRSFDK